MAIPIEPAIPKQPISFSSAFVDPNSGVSLPQAYIVVTNIRYSVYSQVFITYDIYRDAAWYQSGKGALFPNNSYSVIYPSSDWDNFFDPALMDQPNRNILKQTIGYIQSVLPTI